ncbi:hypothetical protein DB30_02131 [Enhygromyxa salina]|uniref:Uncharacterized protein n=1 Tax=Enhygromyxa salina TaxID=215803 RepID=A0A0C1ZM67_9BACT|nr:hypothetical protein [Enhygromyxa salina]KIG12013.1 hypothetical protein DB30_02131 [Enhygromyxa salina]
MSISTLTTLLSKNHLVRFQFTLVRYDARVKWGWDAAGGGCFTDSAGNYLNAGDGFLQHLDAFVERIEADARPVGEPAPGFEVWRFDRDSLSSSPWPLSEIEGCDHDPADVPDEATLAALTSAFSAVLDDAFNAPSLYDGRDLRAGH